MNIPSWVKPSIYGSFVGAVFVGIVEFSLGGWVTEGGATKMANTLSHETVIAAPFPNDTFYHQEAS